MKKSITVTFFSAFILFFNMTTAIANADVPVNICKSSHRAALTLNSCKIIQIVTNEFHLNASDMPFLSAYVKVRYLNDTPDYLIVYLKNRLTLSFEVARIDLGHDYTISRVEINYTLNEYYMDENGDDRCIYPDEAIENNVKFKDRKKNMIIEKKDTSCASDYYKKSTLYLKPDCKRNLVNRVGSRQTETANSLDPNPFPLSCKGYCGESTPGGCYCDDICVNYGDCCDDKEKYCG